MRLKKLTALAGIVAMTAGVLTGCGKTEAETANDNKPTQPQATSGAEQGGNNDTAGTELPPMTDKEITLRYAAWNLGTEEENNLERQMIAAFMEKYPNIKIELADNVIGTDDWNGSLMTAAAGGTLPDVSLIAALPDAIANEWVKDISEYTALDKDWENVPESLTESIKFGNGQYGIPSAMFMGGYFINTNLFEQMNATPLKFGYSLEEWKQAIQATSNPSQGIVALKNSDFIDWYSAVVDPGCGWFTYDGSKVNLNSQVFKDSVKYSYEMNEKGYAYNGLSESAKEVFAVAGDWEAWALGMVAMAYDGTWINTAELPFDCEFVGLPGGTSVIIPDYMFVSDASEYPREAYEFAKFMSFGEEGILKRMEIDAQNDNIAWNSIPLNTSSEIADKYFENYPVKGVKEAFEALSDNSIVEAYKFTPGYAKARWEAPTGITIGDIENATIANVLNSCMDGTLNIDDYADQLNSLSNQYIQEGMNALNKVIQ